MTLLALLGPWTLAARAEVPVIGGGPPPRAVDPVPQLLAIDAETLAGCGRCRTELYFLGQHLVWRVERWGTDPYDHWRTDVDAHTGEIVAHQRAVLQHQGQVFTQRPIEEHLAVVQLDGLADEATTLTGERVTAGSRSFDPADGGYVQRALADEAGDFLFEPDHGDPADGFVEVNAYHHYNESVAFFKQTFDHHFPATPGRITANYRESESEPFDNAFFSYGINGRYELAFGQGTDMDWGYDPGIVLHEFGHGVVEDVSGLFDALTYPVNSDEYGLHPAPGGLTEGLPDYWSGSQRETHVQAEYADGTPLRDMDNDLTCPESVMGEAHADGEVIGGTAWEIRERLGAEAADAVVYRAMQIMGSSPSYAEWGQALLDAAAELLGADEVAAIQQVLDDRGISTCGRAVTMTAGVPVQMTMVGTDIIGEGFCELGRAGDIHISTPFQFAVEVPSSPPIQALDVDLSFESLDGEELGFYTDLQYAVYARPGELVRYELESISALGYTFSYPSVPADDEVLAFEGNPESVRIADPEPGTWYLSVIGLNCKTTELTVTADTELVPAQLQGCRGLARARAAFMLPLLLLPFRRRW